MAQSPLAAMPEIDLYRRDIARAFAVLKGKAKAQTKYWMYYDGDAPTPFASKRIEEIFDDIGIDLSQNWSAVVIDAVTDRISLEGFSIPQDTGAEKLLEAVFKDGQMLLEADEAHRAALIAGEAYVIAWPNEETGIPELYYQDGRMVHIFTDPESPRRKCMAVKWWDDDDNKRRLTLYYPDTLVYLISTGTSDDVSEANSFEPFSDDWVVKNPTGIIPVFALRPELRRVKSDLKNVVPLQDAINMLFADVVVTGETAALPQKWIISNAAELTRMRSGPNTIWHLPPGDMNEQPTSVGQFPVVSLDSFLNSIDKIVSALAAITRTPKHYFFLSGGDVSGEALVTMEGPVNKKARDRIARFDPVWIEIAQFILTLLGQNVPASSIVPRWAAVETIQPLTQAQIVSTEVGAGVPLVTSLLWHGRSEAEIAAMRAEKDEESQAASASLGQALIAQQRAFDQQSGSYAPGEKGNPNVA